VQRAATVMQDDADIGLGAVHQPSRRERLARLESQARRAHGRRRRRPCAARERPDIGHTGGHCPGAAGGRGLRDALATRPTWRSHSPNRECARARLAPHRLRYSRSSLALSY
jgi:hypothetical protein